ncbi:uncharacterized protein Z519_12445 [Cladophialophora bantiana CBS 173.52]|uniref:SnoaL-like domain-containing protein n=1 Tax=Cladophialophora bantiana (strain ATCC 10958 / CBS 173.52 / CDC B-1940 / NIH 8579) TaxID=1442370 RepID=A0A0D2H801_CLAB1|nr:uncharacterized protein Z519_12445 [Cladophialophora bantiana CBS 173.52]KIW86980.1 hypothetical protein Z519_12445 [Cladophialophora bantiana CBS 173.52]
MATVEERNKEVITKYFTEYWGKLNPDIVDEVCADDVFQSYPMHANPKKGKAAVKQAMVDFKAAFPNLGFKTYGPYPLIAEGDYVFGRWIGGGIHTGAPFDDFSVGALTKANTGKQMWFSGMTIFTMKDGKIVKEIGEEGGLTALQQLGLIEPPKKGREMFYDVENM